MGVSHGNGMSIVYVPSEKLLYAADLITPNRVPFSTVPDFNMQEWVESLDVILSIDWEKGLWSHAAGGDDGTLTSSRQPAVETKQFIIDLRDAVTDAFQNVKTGRLDKALNTIF